MARQLADWTEDDLQSLIRDGVQESLHLDYKASRSLDKTDQKKINEMSKDVAAFANSDGGRIIYGVIEVGHLPQSIDDGVTDLTVSREWIEQKLQSTIKPRVQGITIKQIPLSSGGNAFVIDIPAATAFAPHMASDNKYYRRFNFSSVPMEDYEVKDSINRSTSPDLFAKLRFQRLETEGSRHKITVSVYVGNNASSPALYSAVSIFLPHSGRTYTTPTWNTDNVLLTFAGERRLMTIASRNLIVPDHQPLWRGKEWDLGSFDIHMDLEATELVGWQMEWPEGWSHQWFEVSVEKRNVVTRDVTPATDRRV